MNIAILISSLTGGGAERVASLIGNYYIGEGHNVYYFIGNYGVRKRYDVKGQVIDTDIRFIIGSSGIADLIKSVSRIRKLKRKYEIDIAISFMEDFNYINILSRGREKVFVRVCRILSIDPDHIKSIFLNRYILGFTYNMSDRVIVMSDYAVNDMNREWGVRKKKLYKISNPISTNEYSTEDKEEWQFGDKVIICVGRLANEKQQNIAIKAFSVVCETDSSARLILLGDGYNRKKIEKMIKQAGLSDRVHLLGFQKDIYYYLKHSKVFLMTSQTEGFPNAMLEALNAGLPVISTDAPGGIGEILGKSHEDENTKYCKYGIVTPYILDEDYNVKSITEGELQLGNTILEVLNDADIYEKYHRQSLKRAKWYQTERIMKRWNKLFLQ